MAKDKPVLAKHTTVCLRLSTMQRLRQVSLELAVKLQRKLSISDTVDQLLDRLPREKK